MKLSCRKSALQILKKEQVNLYSCYQHLTDIIHVVLEVRIECTDSASHICADMLQRGLGALFRGLT